MNWLFDTIARLVGQVVFWATVQPWEQGIRVRFGKHVRKLAPGMHLRIPILDQVHTQSACWRSALVATQTLSTRDGATLIAGGTIGYVIADIEALYRGLHHAEDTIGQITAAAIAAEVQRRDRGDVTPDIVGEVVTEAIRDQLEGFGLSEISLRLTDFAFVRAFRIVQDQRWMIGRPLETATERGVS